MVVILVGVVLEGMVIMLRDVDLAADDGLDGRVFLRYLEKFLDPVHVAVVGDGQGGHAEFLGPLEKVLDRRLAVEDRVLGMDVQVDEGHIGIGLR